MTSVRSPKVAAPLLAGFAALVLMAGSASAAGLTEDAKGALLGALDDEYHAEAVYQAVIDRFGAVRPFTNIIRAERQHQAMVIERMKAYGVAVPANPYLSGAKPIGPLLSTIAGACAVGVKAEMANRDLYDKTLLPKVTAYPDITQVLKALRDASQEKHLPAFQRCAG